MDPQQNRGRCPACAQPLREDGLCPRCPPNTAVRAVQERFISTLTVAQVGAPLPLLPPVSRPDSSTLETGRVIAQRYRIRSLIGSGGMGQVYRAWHLALGKDVCVKVRRENRTDDDEAVRFQREAQVTGRLRSRHIVQIVDAGREPDGLHYIAMELIEGRSLKDVLTQEFPLGEERICHIMAQVLAACADAHAHRVIHRDLKPANIMIERHLDHPDFVKVLDFGVAKIQEPEFVSITNTDATCGTPAYMSPEQGLGLELDGRSDIYTTGVILYQLATGWLPFDGKTPLEVLTRHQSELPLPPRLRRPEVRVSPEMERLILSALEKDPARRPQTAEEFRSRLLKLADRLRLERERTERSEKSIPPARVQPAVETRRDEAARPPLMSPISRPPSQGAVVSDAVYSPTTPEAPSPGGITEELRIQAGAIRRRRRASIALAISVPLGIAGALVVLWLSPAGQNGASGVAAPASRADLLATQPLPPTAGVASVTPVDSANARHLFEKAARPFFEENYEKAAKLYREAIAADPDYASAYLGLFKAGLGMHDRKAIREGGEGYLRLKPHSEEAVRVRDELRKG
jgi:serine/threonine protein kinase